jgi:ADP-ribosylation factor GTPase-activating protein 2/3
MLLGCSNKRKLTSCLSFEETSTTARDRFGTQKGISSDMYFERGGYDPAAAAEAQDRLKNFQGATAISSNAYFGRDENANGDGEDDDGQGHSYAGGSGGGGGGGEGYLNPENLANLENAARDAIQRVMANPDVQNAADSLRAGALKVCCLPLRPSS